MYALDSASTVTAEVEIALPLITAIIHSSCHQPDSKEAKN
jgi:hypothetical protein